ncbi:MAG: carboxypeptidase-like regulatory domain-containing protein, partial [Planctomycetota bacterium]
AAWAPWSAPESSEKSRSTVSASVDPPMAQALRGSSAVVAIEPPKVEGSSARVEAKVETANPSESEAAADIELGSVGRVFAIRPSGEKEPAGGVEVTWRFRAHEAELDDVTSGEQADSLVGGDTGTLSALGYGGPAVPESAFEEGVLETNAEGSFPIDPKWRQGEIKLSIAVDDTFRAVQWESDAFDADLAQSPLELIRVPRGVLAGRVVDLDERPMKGVTVRGQKGWGGELVEAVTDDEGRFQLAMKATSVRLSAELAGHVAMTLGEPTPLATGGWEPHEIVMARAGSLVIDIGPAPAGSDALERGAFALPSFDQHHAPRNLRRFFENSRGLADDRGIVRIDGLPVGQKIVVMTGGRESVYAHRRGATLVCVDKDFSGAAPQGAEPIVIPESGLLEVGIEDRAAQRVHGRVINAQGEGVPNVFVNALARYQASPVSRSILAQTKSDSAGEFEMLVEQQGEPGPFLLSTWGYRGSEPNLEGARLLVPRDEPFPELILQLSPSASLSGRLELADEEESLKDARISLTLMVDAPVTGAPLAIYRRSLSGARVEEDGAFELALPLAGTYELLVRHPAYPDDRRMIEWPAQEQVVIRLARRHGAEVTVHVVNEEGEAVSNSRAAVIASPHLVGAQPLQERYLSWGGQINASRELIPESGLLAPDALASAVVQRSFRGKAGRFVFRVPAGPGWIGAVGAHSQLLDAPRAASGSVLIAEGSSEITLVLSTPVAMKGRLPETLVKEADRLALMVRPTEKGAEFMEVGRSPMGRSSRFVRTSRKGAFAFRAPSGEYELHIGTEAELLSGQAREVMPITVR